MTDQINFSYTLTGTVDLNGSSKELAKEILYINLDDLTNQIMGEGLITEATELTLDSYEATTKVDQPAYPISHGTHIIQYHDETFVWYDEAGLQGGVTYSLEQAQEALKKYSEDLSKSLEDLEAEELKAFKAYLAANPMATYWSTWLASSALGRSPKEASDGR